MKKLFNLITIIGCLAIAVACSNSGENSDPAKEETTSATTRSVTDSLIALTTCNQRVTDEFVLSEVVDNSLSEDMISRMKDIDENFLESLSLERRESSIFTRENMERVRQQAREISEKIDTSLRIRNYIQGIALCLNRHQEIQDIYPVQSIPDIITPALLFAFKECKNRVWRHYNIINSSNFKSLIVELTLCIPTQEDSEIFNNLF